MALFDTIRAGASGATDYEVQRSLRLNKSDGARLTRTLGSEGNKRKWTFSWWFKPTKLNETQVFILSQRTSSSNQCHIMISSDRIDFESGGGKGRVQTKGRFGDSNAWYHCVVFLDSDQSSSGDRLKIYINGNLAPYDVQTTVASGDHGMNNNTQQQIGAQASNNDLHYGGYLAEMNFIDGQAYDPTFFAETNSTTGQWVPKKYTGSYGSQGWYLNFSDNSSNTASTIGADSSGNGHNFTPVNISVSAGAGNDSLADTPTNNFATMNGLICERQQGGVVNYSNGNLDFTSSNGGSDYTRYPQAYSSIGARSGKWYCEFNVNAGGSSGSAGIGVANTGDFGAYTGSNPYSGFAPTAKVMTNTGELRGDDVASGGNAHYTNGDIIGVAMDLDNNKVYWHKNGTYYLSANPNTNTNGTTIPSANTDFNKGNGGYYVFTYGADNAHNMNGSANFGQRDFSYSIPTGYKTLCSQNLPEPTIFNYNKDYFGTKFYQGNGSQRNITGFNFSPDAVWLKKYSGGSSRSWQAFDILRGASKSLHQDGSGSQETNTNRLNAFLSNGYSIGSDDGGNGNGNDYVAWAWDAGSSTVTNTDGDISSQVRALPSAGFSVITYTGSAGSLSNPKTIGHGLGVKPTWIIMKNLTDGENWIVWIATNRTVGHAGGNAGGDKFFALNNATRLNNNFDSLFASQDATSSVWTLGGENVVNGTGKNYVAYAFTDVAGYSNTGVYVGNGNDDGSFVQTDFKPYFIIIKCSSQGEHWQVPIYPEEDNGELNSPSMKMLHPNLNNQGADLADSPSVKIYSNGFKITTNDTNVNGNNLIYWYYALAENPTKYTRGA